jgi:magnesium chelatase family protein
MLAQRLPGLLPPMDEAEALEAAAIESLTGNFRPEQWMQRPFRAPHHTASAVALVGGGSDPRPGEISRAHRGVLFLDEFPEYDRRVLEVLREPLEAGRITISRAARQAEFPARFQLVAAMNPCPCGYLGSTRCRCSPDQVSRYRGRVSGPLMDRLDLQIEVPALAADELRAAGTGESSAVVRSRVVQAWNRQQQRQGKPNSHLRSGEVERWCAASAECDTLLRRAIGQLGLSARGYHRVLKVARTIADLGGRDALITSDIAEAIGYRRLDRAG